MFCSSGFILGWKCATLYFLVHYCFIFSLTISLGQKVDLKSSSLETEIQSFKFLITIQTETLPNVSSVPDQYRRSQVKIRKTFSCAAEKLSHQHLLLFLRYMVTFTRMRVSRLWMDLTLFSTSSSVTSIKVQFMSSSSIGYTPYPVTHWCS